MNIEAELTTILLQVLERPSAALQSAFPGAFLQQLLSTASESGPMNLLTTPDGRYEFQGYPSGSHIAQVAKVLSLWRDRHAFPVQYRPMQDFGTESTQAEVSRCAGLTDLVLRAQDAQSVEELLLALGPRGVLTCLGLRQTQGSVSHLAPPKVGVLIDLFNDLHTSSEERKHARSHSVLTVGARALAKHSHRSSEGFWGEMSGSEAHKNEVASELLARFLRDCVWVNLHQVPPSIPVLELREERGYGARWFLQAPAGFRGFLEPQMKGGHELGWRH